MTEATKRDAAEETAGSAKTKATPLAYAGQNPSTLAWGDRLERLRRWSNLVLEIRDLIDRVDWQKISTIVELTKQTIAPILELIQEWGLADAAPPVSDGGQVVIFSTQIAPGVFLEELAHDAANGLCEAPIRHTLGYDTAELRAMGLTPAGYLALVRAVIEIIRMIRDAAQRRLAA